MNTESTPVIGTRTVCSYGYLPQRSAGRKDRTLLDKYERSRASVYLRFPIPTEAGALSRTGVRMSEDVLTEPALANVGALVVCITVTLLVFGLLLSFIRRRQLKKIQQVLPAKDAMDPRAFGIEAVSYQRQLEAEQILSHIIESGKDVDIHARVNRLEPDVLEHYLVPYSAEPTDLRVFEGVYEKIARMRYLLSRHFFDWRARMVATQSEQLKTLDWLHASLGPIMRKVDWKMEVRRACLGAAPCAPTEGLSLAVGVVSYHTSRSSSRGNRAGGRSHTWQELQARHERDTYFR